MAIKYHYCTQGTFRKIIESSSIRLSDIKKSNDSIELNFFFHQYFGYDQVEDTLNIEGFQFYKTHHMLYQSYIDKTICLATCFSTGKDKLSQWERYGDDGKGISIGFDEEVLNSFMDSINDRMFKINSETNHAKSVFKKVTYEKYKMSFPFHEILDRTKNGLEFIEDSCYIKHYGFSEEKESRAAIIFSENNFEQICKQLDELIVDKNILDTKFLQLRFPKYMISEVLIGPLNKSIRSDINSVLLDNGIECKVSKSTIPYICRRK